MQVGFMAVPCWSRWQESTGWRWTSWAGSPITCKRVHGSFMLKSMAGVNRWRWTSWAGSPITCKGSWQFHVEVLGRSQQDEDEPHRQVHLEHASRVHGSSMLKSLAGVNRMKMNFMGRFTYNMQGFMAVPCWSRWQESTGWRWTSWAGSPITCKGYWQFHVEVIGRSQHGWRWTSWAGSPITCKGSWQFHVEVLGRSQQDEDEPHGQVHL